MTAKSLFTGRNFMTPLQVETGWIEKDKTAYELSTNTRVRQNDGTSRVPSFPSSELYFGPMFGVTVAKKGIGIVTKLGECFTTIEEARNYIKNLSKQSRTNHYHESICTIRH